MDKGSQNASLCPSIGPPGIEPGLHPPHGRVLPVYYGPHVEEGSTRHPVCYPNGMRDRIGASNRYGPNRPKIARPYYTAPADSVLKLPLRGPIAQLVERVIRIDEVRSSTLLGSTQG